MPGSDSAHRGRQLVASRVARAASTVATFPQELAAVAGSHPGLPRTIVTTGIGTSEGHARHLAATAVAFAGQPARFMPTGALASGAPPDSAEDWLVVFSQGLSANARFALTEPEAWGGVVLVTGLALPGSTAFAEVDEEKRVWLEALQAAGVVFVDLECGTEYGALIRVIGARVGYAAGWSLLRTLSRRELRTRSALEVDPHALRAAQDDAARLVARTFRSSADVHDFFSIDRPLLIVTSPGLLEFVSHLSLKTAEGMLRPAPVCIDVLEFAHGPLQSLAERRASILMVEAPAEGAGEGAPAGIDAVDFAQRLAASMDPERHDLRVLRATLSKPFCALEFEAMWDALILMWLERGDTDLVDWPGRDREAALYELAPTTPGAVTTPTSPKSAESAPSDRTRRIGDGRRGGARLRLADATSPEIERAIAAGCRTALMALGSLEQHGAHLPLATDSLIADALLEGLLARVEDAFVVPSVPLGCASEHLDFSGTLSLSPSTLEAVLSDLVASLERHGVERVFLFTAHGGNVDALDAMRERLAARASGLALRIDADLEAVSRMQRRAVDRAGRSPESAGPHAGEYETSVMAAIARGSVRAAECRPGVVATPEEAQALFYPSLRVHAPGGVVGDPSHAAAERGRVYLASWIDLLERHYREAFRSD